jgi:hypothetical protein
MARQLAYIYVGSGLEILRLTKESDNVTGTTYNPIMIDLSQLDYIYSRYIY